MANRRGGEEPGKSSGEDWSRATKFSAGMTCQQGNKYAWLCTVFLTNGAHLPICSVQNDITRKPSLDR